MCVYCREAPGCDHERDARAARQRPSTPPSHGPASTLPMVEIRNLALYDALLGDTETAAPSSAWLLEAIRSPVSPARRNGDERGPDRAAAGAPATSPAVQKSRARR